MGVAVEWYGTWRGSPAGEEGWALLGALGDARPVSRSRTTRTESGILAPPSGPVPVHRKVYLYRGARALLSGAFRTTFAAPGRARREARALAILRTLEFAPDPVALGEQRTAGFLLEARLATRTVEGAVPLDETRPDLELARAAGRAVGRVLGAGLGDLSLSPRNVLAARATDGGWRLAKVDSGRMAPVERGGQEQARDLADLLAGLEGRWGAEHLAALREACAAEAGGLPSGVEAGLPAARARLGRRLPR